MKTILYIVLATVVCSCRTVKTNRDKSESNQVHSEYVKESDYGDTVSDSIAHKAESYTSAVDVIIEFNDTLTVNEPVRIEHEGGSITINAPLRKISRIRAKVKRDTVVTSTVAIQSQQAQAVQRERVIADSSHVVKDVKNKESKGLPLTGFMVFLLLFAIIAALLYLNDKAIKV